VYDLPRNLLGRGSASLSSLRRPWGSLIGVLLGIYLFIYIWAVPMLMLDLVPSWGSWMGGFLIILQGSIMSLWLLAVSGQRGLVAAASIALLSFLVEYAGVSTGIPFGRYEYSGTLGLKIGSVPLPIPFAWLIVVPGAFVTASAIRRPALLVPATALLALWLDLLIEPVAAYVTGYWRWIDHGPYYGIPTSNFVAWGGTALGLALILRLLAPDLPGTERTAWLPRLLFGLAALQFALVDAAYGYVWAALLGCGLLIVIGILWSRRLDGEPPHTR
jgi:putative membrane protein